MSDAAPPAAPPPPPPAEPTTPGEASARLTALKQDVTWTKGLLDGGPKQLAEFRKLHEMASAPVDVDLALSGQHQPRIIQDSQHLEAMGFAAHMRASGLDDSVIRQALSGEQVTKAEFDAVAKWKREKMSDILFTEALMAGDGEPKRLWRAANVVLSNGYKSEASK